MENRSDKIQYGVPLIFQIYSSYDPVASLGLVLIQESTMFEKNPLGYLGVVDGLFFEDNEVAKILAQFPPSLSRHGFTHCGRRMTAAM